MQEGKAEILDCESCDRGEAACVSCPVILGLQPDAHVKVQFYLSLWRRCKRYECLPAEGGVMDQEERLMNILDFIQDVVDEREQKKQDADQRKQEQQARRRGR